MEHAASTLTVITDKMVGIAGILYILAMVLYTFYLIFKNKNTSLAATIAGVTGTAIHLISFFMRWIEFYEFAGGGILRAVPITNLYESLMFFALLLALFYVVLEFKTKNKSLGAFAFAISGATVLFINAIGASSNLNPLVPALQSNWLLAHVSLSFIAYVCFAVSAIAALLYLIKVSQKRKSYYYTIWTLVLGVSSATIIFLILTKVFGSTSMIATNSQIIIGTIVNMSLILAAINLKGWTKIIGIVTMPSIATILGGYVFGTSSVVMVYMIPAIWIGNFVLIYSYKLLMLSKNKNYFIAGIVGIVLKVLVIFGIFNILNLFNIFPEKMVTMLQTSMGLTQLITASLGAILTSIIYYIEKKTDKEK